MWLNAVPWLVTAAGQATVMKIDLACFRHGYLVLYIFCSQYLFRRFLNEFSVPASTMFGGKLFQLFITLDCFTTSLRGMPTEQRV